MSSPKDPNAALLEEAMAKCHEYHEDDECRALYKAAAKLMKLPRRDSRNLGEWNAKHGHDVRTAAALAAGLAQDCVAQPNAESISELYLKNKSPDHVKEIKRSIARTVSRGGHVNAREMVTEEDIEFERQKIREERREARLNQIPTH